MTSTDSPAAELPGGARPTRQRRAVVAALDRLDDFRSAQEIHEVLRNQGDKVGLATVYRTLQSLAASEDVDVLRGEDGEVRYRLCSASHHHHHLVCRDCGRAVEVEGPAVERWATAVALEHGFDEVSHTVELFGRCSRCRDRA